MLSQYSKTSIRKKLDGKEASPFPVEPNNFPTAKQVKTTSTIRKRLYSWEAGSVLLFPYSRGFTLHVCWECQRNVYSMIRMAKCPFKRMHAAS